MSAIRIRNPQGIELVTIDLDSGEVEVHEPTKVDEAAFAFWDAVHTVRNHYRGFNDMIISGAVDGEKPAGDIQISPGNGATEKGGDVTVVPDPYLERSRQS